MSSILIGITLLFGTAIYVSVNSDASASASAAQMCSLPNSDPTAGIYYPRTPDIASTTAGVFTVDAKTGNIFYCDVKSDEFLVYTPPLGTSGEYSGLGGWDTWYSSNMSTYNPSTGILYLVETSAPLQGMIFCYEATVHGCKLGATWYNFPSSYCSQFSDGCDPVGTVLDANLNVYWVDPVNSVLTECYAPEYLSCSTLVTSSQFQQYDRNGKPVQPVGLGFINGTLPDETPGWQFYISDASCAGNVWVTSSVSGWSLSLLKSLGDSLSGIGSSTNGTPKSYQQIFIADTGSCTNSPARILDISPAPITISIPGTTIGERMFLSTCVGQCLGYPEGEKGTTANSSAARNLFYSQGSQDFVTLRTPTTTGTTSIGSLTQSATATVSTIYTTISLTDLTTSFIPTTLTSTTTVNITNSYDATALYNITQTISSTLNVTDTYNITETYFVTIVNSTESTSTIYETVILNATETFSNNSTTTSEITNSTN